MYYAHSTNDLSERDWQPLCGHLHGVGKLAAAFAAAFGAETIAEAMGCTHDLGKYTLPFQKRLRGSSSRVDHSTLGARIVRKRFGSIGLLMAYGICGHHAGLANGKGEGKRTSLDERLKTSLPALQEIWEEWEDEVSLPDALGFPKEFKCYGKEQEAKGRFLFQLAFFARMLFSCLVDADFLDTEDFYCRIENRSSARNRSLPELSALRERLDIHLIHLQSLQPDREINRIRADILQHVRAQAKQKKGIFSLTVPTGGGKTLASLAFALDHAQKWGLRRVIFVIPYTSIVEQNAKVFREALGELGDAAVLEHHSAFVEQTPPERSDPDRCHDKEKLKLAMENWDAPIVVTTAVQFFESLFAARSGQCRKLHNIANSVVILDEVQTLPLKLLRPCVASLDELARNYRASIVLCTATQPALNAPDFEGGLLEVRELAPDPPKLFEILERVRICHVGVLDDEALVQEMRAHEQVLCIVNNRRHARALFKAMSGLPGAYHLSTLMCARHRSVVLDKIRLALEEGRPCRVVSTSLIEAGVDVDFPTVLRAEAGLDSIAQAAGRCNREGKRSREESIVKVFATENEDWAPPAELKQYAAAARETLSLFGDRPLSQEAIRHYFKLLYWQKGDAALDAHDLMGLLKESRSDSLPLETLDEKFRMIESMLMPVIVPHDDVARTALDDLKYAPSCSDIARKLQPYIAQLPKKAFDALYVGSNIAPVAPEKWGEQFMALTNQDLYDPKLGLGWDDPSFHRAESLVSS
ncbi:MAG: CRISPR-associated endonuclease Cas3'' [Azoarcus sp.]|jgi:CRISPR-associated endonuclease/helicase Cas3|nr:CRISPR-associated endonuclease Cas3'' [Azoarcus sp.]